MYLSKQQAMERRRLEGECEECPEENKLRSSLRIMVAEGDRNCAVLDANTLHIAKMVEF